MPTLPTLYITEKTRLQRRSLIGIATNGPAKRYDIFIAVEVITAYQLDQDCKCEHSPF